MEDKIIIKINSERCKGCMLCIKACPKKALKASGKVNKKGQQYVFMEQPDKCTACGLCFIMCPECAIEIVKDEKGKTNEQ